MRRCRNGIKPCSCKSEVDLFVEQTQRPHDWCSTCKRELQWLRICSGEIAPPIAYGSRPRLTPTSLIALQSPGMRSYRLITRRCSSSDHSLLLTTASRPHRIPFF